MIAKIKPQAGALGDPRSWGLIAISLVFLSRGFAYTVTKALEPLPYGLKELTEHISIKTYGVLWLVAAVLGLWMAIYRRRTIWAVSFMSGMPTLWGLAYGISWVISGFAANGGWTALFLYLCLSVIVVSLGVIQPQKLVIHRGSRW